jgi:hypothetical protein
MPPVSKSLQVIAGFFGSAVKSFAIAFIVIDLIWGGLLAAVAFWWASEDSIWQGVMAVIWTIIVMGSLGVTASIQFSIFASVKQAVKESRLGSRISADGETVRFAEIRDRLGEVIDQRVTDLVAGLSWKITGQLLALATGLVALGCPLIR